MKHKINMDTYQKKQREKLQNTIDATCYGR